MGLLNSSTQTQSLLKTEWNIDVFGWKQSVQLVTVFYAPVVAGGKETQHDVWKYNGALDKWIQIEALATGRWRHKMAVHGGKVYALGGFDGVQRLASVEAYDPFHNRWSQVNVQELFINVLLWNFTLNVLSHCSHQHSFHVDNSSWNAPTVVYLSSTKRQTKLVTNCWTSWTFSW